MSRKFPSLWAFIFVLPSLLSLCLLASSGRAIPVAQAASLQSIHSNLQPLQNIKQIVVGGAHACALTTGGGVKCWGANTYGQVGDGTTADKSMPSDIIGLSSGVTNLTAGWAHTCALTSTGGVKCWGYNNYGQLGIGTTDGKTIATDVSGLSSGMTAVSAGLYHTCAVTNAGGVKCWGRNEGGQLGEGTTTNKSTPTDVTGLNSGISALAAGEKHSCALNSSGAVFCWGANNVGQLGDGSNSNRNIPTAVSGLASGIARLTAGIDHTCVLNQTGGVKCWGANYFGQLGDNTTNSKNIPIDVSGLSSSVQGLSAGYSHTCALLTSGGIRCWGQNDHGQLGDGTQKNKSIPTDVTGISSGMIGLEAGEESTCALTNSGTIQCWGKNDHGQLGNGVIGNKSSPIGVSGLNNGATKVAAGSGHSCAVAESGHLRCWGWNGYGQLGDGTKFDQSVPTDVSGLGNTIMAAGAGAYHSCALTNAGGVKCWGANSSGQLGDGTTVSKITPTDVSGLSSGVITLTVGWGHACVILNTGGVQCWGQNEYGQLGDTTTVNKNTATNVNGLSNGVTALAAGINHTCALTSAGAVKCWGRNDYGQLGDGTTTTQNTPINVRGLGNNNIAVTAGAYHTCAVTNTGGVKCWGRNDSGQLGDSSGTHRSIPSDVTGLSSGQTGVFAGAYHTCALTSVGGVKCWGLNSSGQLGIGTISHKNSPVDVNGFSTGVIALAAGAAHTCALTDAGAVNCWGANDAGQVGDGSAWQRLPVAVVVDLPCNLLTLTHTGSGGNSSPTPANSAGCAAGYFSSGEAITLTASPAVGWRVTGWSGTTNDVSTDNNNSLRMSAISQTVTVHYQLLPTNTSTSTLTATATPSATATIAPTFTVTATQTAISTPTLPPSGNGDGFENDNDCSLAKPINTDGSTQTHNFHALSDADWVVFDAVANAEYRIEVTIPDSSDADVDLEVYAACDAVPDKEKPSFNPGVRLNFTALATGKIHVKLSNHDGAQFGAAFRYVVNVRQLADASSNRALIIVAGRLRGSDRLQKNINNISQNVYKIFQKNNYDDDSIKYLATDTSLSGWDENATKANLQAAITTWAAGKVGNKGVLTLYMVDHGHPDLFYMDEVNSQRISPSDLNDWLTQLETAAPGVTINVIIEACQSGSFIQKPNTISKAGRLVITSTDADNDAKASQEGAYFSDQFLSELAQGRTLASSFSAAQRAAKRIFSLQDAWLDGDGDSLANQTSDTVVAEKRSFADKGTLGEDWAPYIFSVQPPPPVINFSTVITADVRDDKAGLQVKVVVYPPDYTPPATGQELQPETLDNFNLLPTGTENQYAGKFSGFTQIGTYRLMIYADDKDGLAAVPVEVLVNTGSKVFLPLVTR